jgi:NAD(P)-dependent dehydrogenase (short-subunit alcohol dehydrogenase family)
MSKAQRSSTWRSLYRAATSIRDRFGRIDILVNNAGIGPGAIRPDSWQRPLKFWEITADQWRRFVAVHTTAPPDFLDPADTDRPSGANW